MEFITIFIVWIFGSVLAGKLAERKGRQYLTYFLISLLLSPLVGILAAAIAAPDEKAIEQARVASGTERKCPYCAEVVKAEATICRFCHKDLPALEAPPPAMTGEPRFTTKAEYDAWKAKAG